MNNGFNADAVRAALRATEKRLSETLQDLESNDMDNGSLAARLRDIERGLRRLVPAGAMVLFAWTLFAPSPAQAAVNLTLSDVVEKASLKGDLRLRQEYFDYAEENTTAAKRKSRSRQRYRLRLGLDFGLKNNLSAKFSLASGENHQSSTNQSFDQLGSKKGIFIDTAYLEWKPVESVTLLGGKMKMPLWVPYSGDIVWDNDYTPEGFGQQAKFSAFGAGRLFVNAMQSMVDEESNTGKDQWQFSEQIGLILPMPADSRLTVSAANHYWLFASTMSGAQAGNLAGTTTHDGNRRSGTNLLNNFSVVELTAEYATWVAELPLSIQGTYIKNVGALDKFSTPSKEDTGMQFGAILGKAEKANAWEAAYFYKTSETDATVADVADSDFGDAGGTNRKGSLVWLAYGLNDATQVKAKYFMTETLEDTLSPNVLDVNRLQVDVQVKF